MLGSLALMLLTGTILGWGFSKLRLPGLIGMLMAGILLGPHAFNLIDASILNISPDLKTMALVIILMRAGLSLDINDLKRVGRPAILMCFVPACLEILGMIIIAPKLLGVSVLDAAIMGAVIGAVSPAVIIPKMLYLMENRYGTNKSIPQLIMAGASVDDVFVIVVFTALIGLAQGNGISSVNLLQIPASIITGATIGVLLGIGISYLIRHLRIRTSIKVLTVLSFAFLLIALENWTKDIVPFSGLLAVMSLGMTLQKKNGDAAKQLSSSFSKLWIGAEVVLFVLVGAAVDLSYAADVGIVAIVVVLGVLVFRMVGVFFCMLKTELNFKEKVFCMIAYVPKATVQAAISSIPLSLGLPCGNIVLTVAVLAIIITAPLGALGIDMTYKRLL